jgi:hypothetical protein
MTRNHDYRTPPRGAANWHEPLNENFERLDRDVEVRDRSTARDEYDPTQGAKFYAVDTGELYLGDGERWRLQGSVSRASAKPDLLRVFGADRGGAPVFSSEYDLEGFDDIGDAVQTAHDDLVSAGRRTGGAIELPVGTYDLDTPIEFVIPISLIGRGGSDWYRNAPGTLGVNTRLNWVGGSADVLTVRATEDSLLRNPSHVPGVHLEGFLLTNDGGNASRLVHLDGTDTYADGTVVPKFTVERLTLYGTDGPEFHARGTAFQGSFYDFTVVTERGRGLVVENASGNPSGGPSQYYFYNPFFYSKDGGLSADISSQQVGIWGGTVAGERGGNGVKLGFRGGVWGMNVEGPGRTGTTGVTLWGGGPWEFKPAVVQQWDTGLSIGDPEDRAQGADGVRFAFKGAGNSSEDVLVQAGGFRRNWTPLVEGLRITDQRGTGEKNSVPIGNRTDTVTIRVDATGRETVRLTPGHGSYDSYESTLVSTDDGRGGAVTDFALGEPIVTDEPLSHPIEATVPVVTASETRGATATLRFVFKRYT